MEGVVAAYPAQQSSRTLVGAQVGTSDSNGNGDAGTGKAKRSSSTSRVGTHRESEATLV